MLDNLVQHFVAGANDCGRALWRTGVSLLQLAATALVIRLVGTQLSFPAFPAPHINPLKDWSRPGSMTLLLGCS